MSYYHIQSPRQEDDDYYHAQHHEQEHYSAATTDVPDHKLILNFSAKKNVLPRLSRSLDKILQSNDTIIKRRKDGTNNNNIDVIAALGLPETKKHDEETNKKKQSVPRRKRVINYGESKKDLTRGNGTKVRGPGGSKMTLDQYGGKIRRRRHHIMQIRGHTLGGILAEKQDRSKFLVLRDFQLPEIIAKWQKYFLRAVIRTWHHVVEVAKEDMLRYRKMFIKSDRELKKRAFKVLRHEADLAMAQRANSQLNNHSLEDEEKNNLIRDFKAKAKVSRAKIISLELQNDSLMEEKEQLKKELAKWMEIAKGGGGGGGKANVSNTSTGTEKNSVAAGAHNKDREHIN
jgi:hypothetical protein